MLGWGRADDRCRNDGVVVQARYQVRLSRTHIVAVARISLPARYTCTPPLNTSSQRDWLARRRFGGPHCVETGIRGAVRIVR